MLVWIDQLIALTGSRYKRSSNDPNIRIASDPNLTCLAIFKAKSAEIRAVNDHISPGKNNIADGVVGRLREHKSIPLHQAEAI